MIVEFLNLSLRLFLLMKLFLNVIGDMINFFF